MSKSTVKISVTLLVIAVVIVSGWAWITLETSASDVADDTTALKDASFDDQALIERGEYVMRAADCAACHSREYGEFAGGYEMQTPFGTLLSSNITPDVETGIGNMTERDFFNAIRQGIGSHGLEYPAMPFTAYRKLTDEDMHALWAYWTTVEPVKHEVDENAGMPFPFNIRLAMAGWDMLFFDNSGFEQDKDLTAQLNRGRYLVEGPGHCSTCHTPRNMLGAEKSGEYLYGTTMTGWHYPDITPAPHTLVGSQDNQAIARYLKTGTDGKAVAGGPMAEAVKHSLQYMTDEDIQAITVYLKAQKPSTNKMRQVNNTFDVASMNKDLAYEVNCASCHGREGEGVAGTVPVFAGNVSILADDPTNLIHIMLTGSKEPHVATTQTAGGMPSYGLAMTDEQIADMLNYVRNSWGNEAKEVTPGQVKELRKQLDAPVHLVTEQRAE